MEEVDLQILSLQKVISSWQRLFSRSLRAAALGIKTHIDMLVHLAKFTLLKHFADSSEIFLFPYFIFHFGGLASILLLLPPSLFFSNNR